MYTVALSTYIYIYSFWLLAAGCLAYWLFYRFCVTSGPSGGLDLHFGRFQWLLDGILETRAPSIWFRYHHPFKGYGKMCILVFTNSCLPGAEYLKPPCGRGFRWLAPRCRIPETPLHLKATNGAPWTDGGQTAGARSASDQRAVRTCPPPSYLGAMAT